MIWCDGSVDNEALSSVLVNLVRLWSSGGVVNVLKWRGWPAHYGSFFGPRIIVLGVFLGIPLFLWVYFWGHYFYGSVFERALFFWVKSSSGWPFFACWSWNFIIFMGIFLVKIIFMGRFLLGKLFFSVRVKFLGPGIPVTLVYWLPPPRIYLPQIHICMPILMYFTIIYQWNSMSAYKLWNLTTESITCKLRVLREFAGLRTYNLCRL